jgi:hypothetical protein
VTVRSTCVRPHPTPSESLVPSTWAALSPTLANYDSRIPFEGVADTVLVGSSVMVGSYPPNAFGLHDLVGNVWEWTEDEYCPYSSSSAVDPVQSCGSDTIPIRGGSWYFSAGAARCGRRYTHARGDSGFSLGFRVLREVGADGGRSNTSRRTGASTRYSYITLSLSEYEATSAFVEDLLDLIEAQRHE